MMPLSYAWTFPDHSLSIAPKNDQDPIKFMQQLYDFIVSVLAHGIDRTGEIDSRLKQFIDDDQNRASDPNNKRISSLCDAICECMSTENNYKLGSLPGDIAAIIIEHQKSQNIAAKKSQTDAEQYLNEQLLFKIESELLACHNSPITQYVQPSLRKLVPTIIDFLLTLQHTCEPTLKGCQCFVLEASNDNPQYWMQATLASAAKLIPGDISLHLKSLAKHYKNTYNVHWLRIVQNMYPEYSQSEVELEEYPKILGYLKKICRENNEPPMITTDEDQIEYAIKTVQFVQFMIKEKPEIFKQLLVDTLDAVFKRIPYTTWILDCSVLRSLSQIQISNPDLLMNKIRGYIVVAKARFLYDSARYKLASGELSIAEVASNYNSILEDVLHFYTLMTHTNSREKHIWLKEMSLELQLPSEADTQSKPWIVSVLTVEKILNLWSEPVVDKADIIQYRNVLKVLKDKAGLLANVFAESNDLRLSERFQNISDNSEMLISGRRVRKNTNAKGTKICSIV